LEKFLKNFGLPLGLLVAVIILQLIYNQVPLFSLFNVKNILLETVSIAITALALSYIMISGEGDLSFAGMFSLLTVLFATLSNRNHNFWVAFFGVAAVSLGVYLLISLLVTRLGFSSFIVSIAFMFMANGIEKAIHQQTTLIQDESIKLFASLEFGLPLIIWLMIFAYLISYLVIIKTPFGFALRIVGENKAAAVEAGINTSRMKVAAYFAAGLLIALAGVVESTRVGAIYEQGKFYMLPVFAAVFLGSSMFTPGRINVFGTLVGALFMGIIEKFMNMISVESYIVSIAQGVILIVSIGLVSFKNRDKIIQIKL
jgi:ribose transport system permease protein